MVGSFFNYKQNFLKIKLTLVIFSELKILDAS